MPYLLLICQFILAVVLLAAATGKLLVFEQFADTLRLSHLPRSLIRPLVILTPAIELCLAAALVLSPPQLLPIAMIITTGLFGIFTGWIISVYARGLKPRCNCFGAGSSEVGPRIIARNALLILMSLGGAILARSVHSPLPDLSIWMLITTISVGMSIMLLVAFRRAVPALVLSKAKLLQLQKTNEL